MFIDTYRICPFKEMGNMQVWNLPKGRATTCRGQERDDLFPEQWWWGPLWFSPNSYLLKDFRSLQTPDIRYLVMHQRHWPQNLGGHVLLIALEKRTLILGDLPTHTRRAMVEGPLKLSYLHCLLHLTDCFSWLPFEGVLCGRCGFKQRRHHWTHGGRRCHSNRDCHHLGDAEEETVHIHPSWRGGGR